MKKAITFLGLFLMAFVLLAQADGKMAIADRTTYLNEIKEQLQLKWPKNRTINLVFHGHSVPAGYFVTPNVQTLSSYPHLSLKKVKKIYPWAVVNSITTAIGGENSVAGAQRFSTEVLSHRPDVLFIDYGLNDRRAGLEAAKEAWEQMIEEALEKGVKVILLTPTPDLREDLLASDTKLGKHAAQIRALAAKYKVGLVDSYQLFQDLAKKERLEDYMAQSNHVNALGHDIVANDIKRWFGLSSKNTRPNILWIIAEDLSPDLACYGHSLVKTPNIDALAARGVRFTQAFVTAPVCTPSRTALATGMYQTSINAHHMRYPDDLRHELPAPVTPLNELLRKQGYQTANIKDKLGKGKTDWSFRSDQAYYDTNHWDSLSRDQAFFAVVNLRLTHRPFERDTVNPVDPTEVYIPPYYPDHSVSRLDWAAYLETVQLMDQQVGQVLRELNRRGLAENTIVFFFSDHGRPMTRAKNYHFDAGTHIPLIMASPEGLNWSNTLPPGTVDHRLLSAIDLTATTLALSGAQKPNWMQGRVLLGEQAEPERAYVFCASDRIGESYFKTRSVRSKRYKYIRNFNRDFSINGSATAYRKQMHPIYHLINIYNEKSWLGPNQISLVGSMPKEYLFDLNADPLEMRSLVSDPRKAELLAKMRRELANWQASTRDYGMEEDSEAIIKAFEEYGIQSSTSRAAQIKAMEQAVRDEIEDQKKY